MLEVMGILFLHENKKIIILFIILTTGSEESTCERGSTLLYSVISIDFLMMMMVKKGQEKNVFCVVFLLSSTLHKMRVSSLTGNEKWKILDSK